MELITLYGKKVKRTKNSFQVTETDVYKDKECKDFYCTIPYYSAQPRKSGLVRTFNCFNYILELL